jgi:hypothetical protein
MKNTGRIIVMAGLATLAGVLSACSSESEPEDIAQVREAICSGGGGGGGDACTNGGGYCPPECSTCFTSVQQRIQLQNLWECTPIGGGGGGGGGGPTCSTCQSNYRTCMNNAISCLGTANCVGDWNACSDPLPSCTRPRVHNICTGSDN